MTTKPLSVAQLLVLNTAAQRPDHLVLPLPPTLRVRGATQQQLLSALLKVGLVEELPVSNDALCWRQDQSGQRFALRLTAAGIAAVSNDNQTSGASAPVAVAAAEAITAEIVVVAASAPQGVAANTAPPEQTIAASEIARPTGAARPGGKLGRVLDAVSADAGASLSDLVALTEWQPHTARAALTGLRQRGFAIQLSDQQGRKVYRLTVSPA